MTCSRAVLQHARLSLLDLIGAPDDLKSRSNMPLSAAAARDGPSLFRQAPSVHCDDEADTGTLALLRR